MYLCAALRYDYYCHFTSLPCQLHRHRECQTAACGHMRCILVAVPTQELENTTKVKCDVLSERLMVGNTVVRCQLFFMVYKQFYSGN